MDAVVLLDSLQYRFSSGAFDGFTHVPRCVATSNWTLPSVVSMFTGLESGVHGVHIRPNVINPLVGRVVRADKVKLFRDHVVQCKYPTLFNGRKSLYACQLPIVEFAFRSKAVPIMGLPLFQPVDKTIQLLKPLVRTHDFLFVHLKAAHTPYTASGSSLEDRRISQNRKAVADAEKLVDALFADKDRVIIVSDHGDGACAHHSKHRHVGDHGHVFSEDVLHSVLCANFKIPHSNKLCSTASVHTLLTKGTLTSRSEVYARFPFYVDEQVYARVRWDDGFKISIFVPDGLSFDPRVCYWCVNGLLHARYKGMKSHKVPKLGVRVTSFKEHRLWEG